MDTPPRRSVLITGCSSGIGYTCAHGLHRLGWQVIASARRATDVARLQGEGLTAVPLDLDDPASIATGLAAALEYTGGRLDALFNNAAFGQSGAVEDLTRDTLRAQFETNLFGTHDLTRRVLHIMRAQGHGRIIQCSSLLGFVALPFRGAYVASKFALEGLTDALRMELAGTGIHVVLIAPGPILTRFRANAEAAYRRNIDAAASPHRETYRHMEQRLQSAGPTQPFTLPPEAVLRRLRQALDSPRPRPRYFVTLPSHLLWGLRRVLGSRALDLLLRRIGGRG